MAAQLNKMQTRISVVNTLSKYAQNLKLDLYSFKQDIEILNEIQDKEYLCELILKELSRGNKEYEQACAIFLFEIIPNDILEKKAKKFLENNISNDKKIFIISLLKQRGIKINQEEIESYIDSALEMAQTNISNFLQEAKSNLGVQIDLLDFYASISMEEKENFIENIKEETIQESYINAISLLSYVEKDYNLRQDFLNSLLNTNTFYALKGLENFLLYEKNEKITKKIKRKIQKIKLLNKITVPDFVQNSKIDKCYIGLLDGKSNFPLLFSRKNENNSYDLVLITLNTKKGVIAAIGFGEIDDNSLLAIIKRIFKGSPLIKISPVALKSIYKHYRNLNFKTSTDLPYEIIVWENLLNDVKEINYSLSKFIDSKLEPIELNNERIVELFSSSIFENWFYVYNQNEYFDEIINEIEQKKETKLENIEKLIIEKISNKVVLQKDYIKDLINNLILQSYITKLMKRNISSAAIFSLCHNKKYLALFIVYIFRKSIYQYLLNKMVLFEANNSFVNFKTPKKSLLKKEDVEQLINKIEEKWKLEIG